jgi:hypothetical protein
VLERVQKLANGISARTSAATGFRGHIDSGP